MDGLFLQPFFYMYQKNGLAKKSTTHLKGLDNGKKVIRTIKPLKLNLNVPMKFETVELIRQKAVKKEKKPACIEVSLRCNFTLT